MHQIHALDDYIRFLQETPSEVEFLFKDLLIGVTNFFRDPEAFTVMAEKVIPEMVDGHSPDTPIRVWVPGCASGEEAHSIAMLLIEAMERLKKHCHIQIFGTDIDAAAIETARAGVFPESIAADVSEERLNRFFLLLSTISGRSFGGGSR